MAGAWYFTRFQPDRLHLFHTDLNGGRVPVLVEVFYPGERRWGKRPRIPRSPVPSIVILHGVEGSRYFQKEHRKNAIHFASQGFAVFLVHYFSPFDYNHLVLLKSHWELDLARIEEISLRDRSDWIRIAVDAVREIGNLPYIDRQRIGLVGYSLGGFVGFGCVQECKNDPKLPTPRAFVTNWGAKWDTTPVTPEFPPVLMFHATKDPIVPYSWATYTYEQLLKSHVRSVEFIRYDVAEHRLPEPYASHARKKTLEFLLAKLAPTPIVLREPELEYELANSALTPSMSTI